MIKLLIQTIKIIIIVNLLIDGTIIEVFTCEKILKFIIWFFLIGNKNMENGEDEQVVEVVEFVEEIEIVCYLSIIR